MSRLHSSPTPPHSTHLLLPAEALNLTADDIEKIAINSFNMSFISDEKKAAHTAAVKAARAAAGV